MNELKKELIFYTKEMATEICDAIATHPASLKKLCEMFPHFPTSKTIYRWMRYYPEFREMYYGAKAQQVEPLIDKMLEIAQDNSHDYVIENERIIFNSEHLQRVKLEIETYKWIASKLMPKLYGERVQAEILTNDPHGLIAAKEIAQKCKREK